MSSDHALSLLRPRAGQRRLYLPPDPFDSEPLESESEHFRGRLRLCSSEPEPSSVPPPRLGDGVTCPTGSSCLEPPCGLRRRPTGSGLSGSETEWLSRSEPEYSKRYQGLQLSKVPGLPGGECRMGGGLRTGDRCRMGGGLWTGDGGSLLIGGRSLLREPSLSGLHRVQGTQYSTLLQWAHHSSVQ